MDYQHGTQEEFGSYGIIWAYVWMFSVFADLGLYSILTREISKDNTNEKEIIGNIVLLKTVALIIVFLIASVVLIFMPYSVKIKNGAPLIMIAIMFLSLSQVLIGIFQKYLKIIWLSISEIVSRITQLGLVMWVIQADLGYYFFLASFALPSILQFLILYLAAKKITAFSLAKDFKYWKQVLKMSLPLAISIILIFIYLKFSIIILSFLKGEVEVGFYNLVYKILETISFLPAMLVGFILPLLSKYFESNKEQFLLIFNKTFTVLLILALPILIGGIIFSDKIIILLGGNSYLAAKTALQFLIGASFFIFFGNLFNSTLIAINKQSLLAVIYLSGSLFNIIANILVIPKYSYTGVAAVALFTEFLVTSLMLAFLIKHVKNLPIPFLITTKAMTAASIMAFGLWLFRNYNFWVVGFLGCVVYFAICYALKVFTKEELLLFLNKSQ